MSTRGRNDNPRVRARNHQPHLETESNIRIDGLIDDTSIRFPFQRNDQGLLEFPETQLFCCDSRLAVLVADPGVKVTVLRRWEMDEKEGSMAEEASSSTMTSEKAKEASVIAAIPTTTASTTSNVQSSESREVTRVQETHTRNKEASGKSSATPTTTTTTKQMPNEVVASAPNLSAESQSYRATTQGTDRQVAASDPKAQDGDKNKTMVQIEIEPKTSTPAATRDAKGHVARSTEKASVSTSVTGTAKGTPKTLDTSAAGAATQRAQATSRQATEKTSTAANTTAFSSQITEELRPGYFGHDDGELTFEKTLEGFTVFSRSTRFMNSSVETVLSMLEDDRLGVRSERDAFRAVNEWILYDPAARKEHATKLLSGVRFSLMSLQELIRVVHGSRYLFTVPEYRDMLLEAFVWRVACHLGSSGHFLDFEPRPRRDESTHLITCQCHGRPNTSAQSNEGVDGYSYYQAPSCCSSDTFAATCNREPDLCSRVP